MKLQGSITLTFCNRILAQACRNLRGSKAFEPRNILLTKVGEITALSSTGTKILKLLRAQDPSIPEISCTSIAYLHANLETQCLCFHTPPPWGLHCEGTRIVHRGGILCSTFARRIFLPSLSSTVPRVRWAGAWRFTICRRWLFVNASIISLIVFFLPDSWIL